MHHVDTGRVDQPRGVPGDQRDLGAALRGDPGDRVALLARAAVADEAHRIDRLAGAAGGHQQLAAGQVVRQGVVALQQQLGQGGDLFGFGEPARAAVRAGEPPGGGFEHHGPAAAQRGHVVDGGRVLPHLGVHRRREQHRTSRGEQGRGQQIVGAAVHGPGQQVGGGGRDDDQVSLLAEGDMRNRGTSSKTPVCTGWPESASKVAAPTKRNAASVGMTRTSWPASVS